MIITTDLEAIDPPAPIVASFQDVASSKKDGEKTVDYALAETSRIVSQARGEAYRVQEEAHAYRLERIARARGEASRFLSLLGEYVKEPEVFRTRVRLKTLEEIIPKIRTYILDDQPGDPHTRIKLIDSNK